MQFKAITMEDKLWVNKYLGQSGYRGCEFSFSTMMMWKEIYKTEVAEYKDVLCFRSQMGHKQKHVYAFPAGNGDKKAAIEGMMNLAKKSGQTFVMRGFEKEWAKWLERQFPDLFEISTCPDEWDYIYHVEDLSYLKGSKYHGKRNHIARFVDHNEWHYEAINADNIKKCQDMSDKWYHAQLEIGNITVLKEKTVVNYALEHMAELDLKGGVLYRGEEVIAFTIGEALNKDTFHVHIEKAYSDIRGAYPMINQQFVLHEMQGYTFINREEDEGILGLRKAKKSYYPVDMVEKYKAVLKQSVI